MDRHIYVDSSAKTLSNLPGNEITASLVLHVRLEINSILPDVRLAGAQRKMAKRMKARCLKETRNQF